MLQKPLILGLFLYILTIFPLGAATVSFLVIETGLPEGGPVNQYSNLWENSLLDVFFESGHIVTNAPMLRLTERPTEDFPAEAERDYDDAKDSGMHYFLIAIVNHPAPHNVILHLFSTRNQQLLQKQVYNTSGSRPRNEEQANIKKTIGAIAAQLQ